MSAGTGIGRTHLTFKEKVLAPSTPTATYSRLFFKADGLHYINSAGADVAITGTTNMTTAIAPAENAAVSQAIVSVYIGVVITAGHGVSGLTIVAPGTGYLAGTLGGTGGGGTGFAGTYTVSGGAINSVTVTDPGANYTSAPTIVISDPGNADASITASIASTTQTLANPLVSTPGRVFTVVNNDTSTANVSTVANGVTFTLTPGEAQSFIWDGTAWGPTDLGITALPVPANQGGTGLSTITDHGIMLGSGTGTVTPMAVLDTGQMVVGVTGADPTTVAANITTTKKFLAETGTGAAGATPVFDTIISGDLTTALTTSPAIGGTTANTIRSLIDEDVEAASDTLTANQCSGGLINNFGQDAANADITITLPVIAAGYNFTVVLGDTQANFFRIDPNGSDSIYLDGVTTGDGKYVQIASAVKGACIQFFAFQTAAAAWDWLALTVSGAWTAEA